MERYRCYFDASYRDGIGTLAYIVKNSENNVVLKTSKAIKCRNSYIAEANALRELLNLLKAATDIFLIAKGSSITIYGDCESIINIVRREGKYRRNGYRKMYNEIVNTYIELRKNNNMALQWIRRNNNKEADALARELLRKINVIYYGPINKAREKQM